MDRRNMGNAAWGFRRLPLSGQLDITARMGLGVHELGIANGEMDLPLETSFDRLEEVRNLYKEYGIGLVCAATGNDFTVPEREHVWQDVEKVQRATAICAKLGVRFLRIFAGFAPAREVTGDRWKQMMEALCQVTEYAGEKGVTLCVETHGKVSSFPDGVLHAPSVTTQLDILERMLEELPSGLKLVYDPANLYAAGEKNLLDFYIKMQDRIGYIHLKDFLRLPSGHLTMAACGEGEMDWNNIWEKLQDFSGPMLFEYEIPEDVEQGSRRCLDFCYCEQ